MLKITNKIKYGFRAMIFLAQQEKTVSVKQISESEKISHSFLEQIIHELKQAGLVKSKRGASGGFTLAAPLEKITIQDIVNALEDGICLADCLDSNHCTCELESTCLAKDGWKQVQSALLASMSQVSLDSLINKNL